MTTRTFLLSLLFLLTACISFSGMATAQQKGKAYDAMAAEVLTFVNKHRAKLGLKPMEMKEAISKYAEQHSRNMATGKTPFGHNGMNERVTRANKDMKQDAAAWAENVAYGAQTAEGVVDQWLHSPGHRKNIEGDYNQTGIGITKNSDGILYYTQIFIRKR